MPIECVFCKILKEKTEEIIYENDYAFVLFDKSPFNRGHLLVISKKHYVDAFESQDSFLKLMSLALKIGEKLHNIPNLNGVNFYQNNSHSKTHIGHLHVHIVPTFENDGFKVATSNLNTQKDSNSTKKEISDLLNTKVLLIEHNISLDMFHSSAKMVNNNLEYFRKHMNRDTPVGENEVIEWYNRYVKEDDLVVLIQNEKNEIIGSAHLSKNLRNKNHSAKLSILVDSSYQRSGLGEKLLNKLMLISREKGIHRIEAEPAIDNSSAIQFLTINGFRIEGVQHHKLKLSNGDFQDCLLMFKLL
jgi:histidine triad (HIT) family protein